MRQVVYLLVAVLLLSCNNDKKHAAHSHGGHGEGSKSYTCPMPQDSVFSDQPGNCPKCGMALVALGDDSHKELDLETVLKPTNAFVLSTMLVVTADTGQKDITVNALGVIAYDTRQIGNISANISGRVEKLYVRHRFQKIEKGQKIMDIYSPEVMHAQENLLFLLKNDPSNEMMIRAAKQKLLLLGMSGGQLTAVIQKGKPDFTISIYSKYSGHIHEAGTPGEMAGNKVPMEATMTNASSVTTMDLKLKEGMYVEKGQTIFSVYDPRKSWVLLSIFPEHITLVKKGQKVVVVPEVAPHKKFEGNIDFIEPFFREGTKTITARVYFDNARMKLPVGSQVTASIATPGKSGTWLPRASVVSLGLSKVVFKKSKDGFIAAKVQTGIEDDQEVEILKGLEPSDSVAANAQYLMDSESFIRTKK